MLQLHLPWLLLLAPLPFLARRFLSTAKINHSAALKIPFLNALKTISPSSHHQIKNHAWQRYTAYLIWCLLVTAAAAPQWVGNPLHSSQSGRDIFLAVDISGSMQIPDMQLNHQEVDRLTAVKTIASDFISQRTGDRLGLILFGSKAYLQTPLTFDRDTVQAMLDDASIGLAGKETAMGDAIGLAIKHLQNTPREQRVLILLTDGANNAGTVLPLEAAQVAAQNQVRIYTIGMGSETENLANLFGHTNLQSSIELDIPTLQAIAQITKGLFFRAKDTTSLKHVYQTLDKLEPTLRTQSLHRPVTPLYPWPLAMALLLSILLSLRHVRKGKTYP